MVFASHIRLALLGTAALLSLLANPAQATSSSSSSSFQFTPCADDCVTSSGCQADSAKCMCKQARNLLLDSVISCMFFNCVDDLRNFQAAFLEPIESGCEANKRGIPSAKIKEAEGVASSYIAMLPSSSPTAPPAASSAEQASPSPTPATTTSDQPASSSAQQDSPSSTSTSSDAGGDGASTSSAGLTSSNVVEATSASTQVTAPQISAATQAAATASSSSASDSGSNSASGGGFNTDPFASPSSAGSAIQPILSLLLGVPAAIWMFAAVR